MKGNSILFVIALIAAIAMTGSVQASTTVEGDVNSTVAEGEIVTIWLDEDPSDYVTTAVRDYDSPDYFFFDDVNPLLMRHGYSSGSTDIPATVSMFCSGEKININQEPEGPYNNVYRNVTQLYYLLDFDSDPPVQTIELEPCPAEPVYDVNVSDIILNPGNYRDEETPRLYVNQVNTIRAIVCNNGTDTITTPFNVSFYANNGTVVREMCNVTVPVPLGVGDCTDVDCTWTPTCEDYPGLTAGYPAKSLPIWVNASAHYADSNAGNNDYNKYVPTTTPLTICMGPPPCLHGPGITGVVNIGYESKNFDCEGDPMSLFNHYIGLIGGGMEYNVSGAAFDLESQSDPINSTVDRTHSITLPSGASVVDARLYVYSETNHGSWTTYVGGAIANLSVNVDSAGEQGPAATYTDIKGFDACFYNRQTDAFDVTAQVSGSGTYDVTVKNIDPTNATTVLGEKLVVVYEDADHGDTVDIWVLEGNDYLRQGATYSVSVAEATATVGFGSIDTGPPVDTATLFAGASLCDDPGANLLFNGNIIKSNAWQTEAYLNSSVSIEEIDVTTALTTSGNNMGFQDESEHVIAYETILVVTKKSEVVVSIDPCDATIGSDSSARTTVNISLQGITDYGSGTIHLYFDTTYVDIDSIGFGDSTYLHSSKVTDGHYMISASNCVGISENVAFANVTFKPMGPTTGCSVLNLVVEKLYDRNFTLLENVTNSCEICIEESNIPGVQEPTASPPRILNDNGRARVLGTNLSTLSVYVTDDTEVATVTINLAPIRGVGYEAVLMTRVSGNNQAGTWSVETNATRDDGASGLGINMTHGLVVTATDTHGNLNNASCVTLKVLRRGDINPENTSIPQNNIVDISDYNEIARYTVGLRSLPDEFTAGTVPADSHNGVDMADALCIALHTVNPGGYPAP